STDVSNLLLHVNYYTISWLWCADVYSYTPQITYSFALGFIMKRFTPGLLFAAATLAIAPITASASYVNSADGKALIEELRQEGINPDHVRNVLGQAK